MTVPHLSSAAGPESNSAMRTNAEVFVNGMGRVVSDAFRSREVYTAV